jgi:hypothetical protein
MVVFLEKVRVKTTFSIFDPGRNGKIHKILGTVLFVLNDF